MKDFDMNIDIEEVINRIKKWNETHPTTREEFWHLQNAIGDILGLWGNEKYELFVGEELDLRQRTSNVIN